MSKDAPGRQRNWRHRENRASTKLLAKRVSQEDHDLVVAYAKSLNVTVARLLDPAVKELVTRARAHMTATSEISARRDERTEQP